YEVKGRIVDTANVAGSFYDQWDATGDNAAAIQVALRIRDEIRGLKGLYPKIENVVIIGNDNIVPFYRFRDYIKSEGEGDLDESDYKYLSPDTPLGRSIGQAYTLTDDYYASVREQEMPSLHGRFMYVPQ